MMMMMMMGEKRFQNSFLREQMEDFFPTDEKNIFAEKDIISSTLLIDQAFIFRIIQRYFYVGIYIKFVSEM